VAMVRTMEECMANDRSLTRRAIAMDLGVDSSQISKWQQQLALHENQITR
jgi:transposase-like protein